MLECASGDDEDGRRCAPAAPSAIKPELLGRLILVATREAILDQLAHGEPSDDAAFSRTLGRMLWLALHDPK